MAWWREESEWVLGAEEEEKNENLLEHVWSTGAMWNYQMEVIIDRCHSGVQPNIGEDLSTRSLEGATEYWLWTTDWHKGCYLKVWFHWIPSSSEAKRFAELSWLEECTHLKYSVVFSCRSIGAGFMRTDSICMLERERKKTRDNIVDVLCVVGDNRTCLAASTS